MVQLPADFVAETRRIMGDERYNRFVGAFDEEAPTSIRVNPSKVSLANGERVPWCSEGYYLADRPQFTFDPLLHAGCYYVQEASSMFVTHILQQSGDCPQSALDMCAAPGGKSTALRSVLPPDCVLISNEPMGNRAQILLENVTKWAHLTTSLPTITLATSVNRSSNSISSCAMCPARAKVCSVRTQTPSASGVRRM